MWRWTHVQSILFYANMEIQKICFGVRKNLASTLMVFVWARGYLWGQHSGAGFYTEDDAIHEIIENAQVVFVEAPSVVNQYNPFYCVHPRRNDRFVTALGPLYDLFPEADFVECHFIKHLITKLITIDAARAEIVFRTLQYEWVRNLTIMRARWRANCCSLV